MAKIIVLHATITGNTELIAETIADELVSLQHEVDMKSFDFDVIDINEVLAYDAILIGTYTWDDGQIPYTVEDFYDELGSADIQGKLFGVFGSADSYYEYYGGAIDMVANRAEELGADVLPNRLKIELAPDEDDLVRCKGFAHMVSEKFN